jgi:preprotein translocase subunit SecB
MRLTILETTETFRLEIKLDIIRLMKLNLIVNSSPELFKINRGLQQPEVQQEIEINSNKCINNRSIVSLNRKIKQQI